MAEQSLFGPLFVPHFDDQGRLDPVMATTGRNRPVDRWRVALGAGEGGGDLRQLLRGEPAAHAAHVPQFAVGVRAEVEGSEPAARASGLGVADHDEVAAAIGADLEPVGRAAAAIRRVGALGHDPFQPELLDLGVQCLAVGREVLRVAQRTRGGEQLLQYLLAALERQRAQIEILEPEDVEEKQRRGTLHGPPLDVGAARGFRAILEALEVGMSGVIEDDYFAVQHDVFVGQRRDGARDFGEARGEIMAVAADQLGGAVLPRRADAVAVELQFEHPPRLRERLLPRLGEHQLRVGDVNGAAGGVPALEQFADRGGAVGPGFELLHRDAGEDRTGRKIFSRGRDVGVALLDQEPFLLALLDLHHRPDAFELVAAQLEEQLAFREAFVGILEGDPAAAVPHDHRARTVVALGNDSLEVPVLHGVVFDVHRQALVGGILRRAFRDGPGGEHSVHLEAQVPVEVAREVHVDDEQSALAVGGGFDPAARLGRAVGGTLGPVGTEGIWFGICHHGSRGV